MGNMATILEAETMEINGLCYFTIIIYEGDLAANGDYSDIGGDRETIFLFWITGGHRRK